MNTVNEVRELEQAREKLIQLAAKHDIQEWTLRSYAPLLASAIIDRKNNLDSNEIRRDLWGKYELKFVFEFIEDNSVRSSEGGKVTKATKLRFLEDALYQRKQHGISFQYYTATTEAKDEYARLKPLVSNESVSVEKQIEKEPPRIGIVKEQVSFEQSMPTPAPTFSAQPNTSFSLLDELPGFLENLEGLKNTDAMTFFQGLIELTKLANEKVNPVDPEKITQLEQQIGDLRYQLQNESSKAQTIEQKLASEKEKTDQLLGIIQNFQKYNDLEKLKYIKPFLNNLIDVLN